VQYSSNENQDEENLEARWLTMLSTEIAELT